MDGAARRIRVSWGGAKKVTKTIPMKRTKDRWCSGTGAPGEHELINTCTYNENQNGQQRKIGWSIADSALCNLSELRLVYHESGGRKLPTERQRNGRFEEKPRRQMVSWRCVWNQQRDSTTKSEVQIHDSRKRITGTTYEFENWKPLIIQAKHIRHNNRKSIRYARYYRHPTPSLPTVFIQSPNLIGTEEI